jgi:hypothetical protein
MKVNFDGLTYRQWETAVDKAMLAKHGVGIDDIPDQAWRDWWADDMEVIEAMDLAIENVNEGGY